MADVPQRKKGGDPLIVILGPTASGKSALGVFLAKKFSGEIISADSRQVYKGLTIGAATISKKEMRGVPHYLLGIVSPNTKLSVASYCKRANKTISAIRKRGRVPFLVGGSPLYIYALVDQWSIPNIKPNLALRKKLEALSLQQLLTKLQKLDPNRAKTIETKNKRRLVRALEIVITTKQPVPPLFKQQIPSPVLFIGLNPPRLEQRIAKRLRRMVQQGLVREIWHLRRKNVSWKRIDEFGFEYRFAAAFAKKEITKEEMLQKIQRASMDFVRRQMSWFKKDPRIRWVKNYKQAEFLTKEFLS